MWDVWADSSSTGSSSSGSNPTRSVERSAPLRAGSPGSSARRWSAESKTSLSGSAARSASFGKVVGAAIIPPAQGQIRNRFSGPVSLPVASDDSPHSSGFGDGEFLASAGPTVATAAAGRATTAVAGLLTNIVDGILTPSARPTQPRRATLPVQSTSLAFSRRQAAGAVIASAPGALATTSLFHNPITVAPTLTLVDGIINGTTNAVDSTGATLTYTVASNPRAGGKITFLVPGDTGYTPGAFTYLPDQSVLGSGDEQFTDPVAHYTQLDHSLEVLLGTSRVKPVLDFLQQVPVVNGLLAPVIGYSKLAAFDSSMAPLPAGTPVAFTAKVTSFDGTQISTNFFPASTLGTNAVAAWGPRTDDPQPTWARPSRRDRSLRRLVLGARS